MRGSRRAPSRDRKRSSRRASIDSYGEPIAPSAQRVPSAELIAALDEAMLRVREAAEPLLEARRAERVVAQRESEERRQADLQASREAFEKLRAERRAARPRRHKGVLARLRGAK